VFMVVIIGVGYLCSFCSRSIFGDSNRCNNTVGESMGISGGDGTNKSLSNKTGSTNKLLSNNTRSIHSWVLYNSLLLDDGLGDNLCWGLVGGNSSLGNEVAHIVSGSPDNGGSLVVGGTNGDSPLAKHGSLHSIGVSLVSPVGEVATKPVALDDG